MWDTGTRLRSLWTRVWPQTEGRQVCRELERLAKWLRWQDLESGRVGNVRRWLLKGGGGEGQGWGAEREERG